MDERVREAFGRVWPAHVASLTRFLIECRRHFDGDLELFLVLGVIGDRTFAKDRVDPDLTYEAWRSGAAPVEPVDINATSIAAFSGIPRETVRRKVDRLVAKGWVARDARGHLRATAKAAADLEPLTLTSLRYVGDMLALLAEIDRPRAPRAKGAR